MARVEAPDAEVTTDEGRHLLDALGDKERRVLLKLESMLRRRQSCRR
jgi:hypothetical protein